MKGPFVERCASRAQRGGDVEPFVTRRIDPLSADEDVWTASEGDAAADWAVVVIAKVSLKLVGSRKSLGSTRIATGSL
ncbi:hypothetical protein [Gordonia sp. (in: high G+C Gram-positive bacteria)]|uniref:hypothetical protein n=1 Tax=Gordonia sp. (in: high G+C Gram-positive bacteria) TaxID=84139 RepID=UPI003F964C11